MIYRIKLKVKIENGPFYTVLDLGQFSEVSYTKEIFKSLKHSESVTDWSKKVGDAYVSLFTENEIVNDIPEKVIEELKTQFNCWLNAIHNFVKANKDIKDYIKVVIGYIDARGTEHDEYAV